MKLDAYDKNIFLIIVLWMSYGIVRAFIKHMYFGNDIPAHGISYILFAGLLPLFVGIYFYVKYLIFNKRLNIVRSDDIDKCIEKYIMESEYYNDFMKEAQDFNVCFRIYKNEIIIVAIQNGKIKASYKTYNEINLQKREDYDFVINIIKTKFNKHFS